MFLLAQLFQRIPAENSSRVVPMHCVRLTGGKSGYQLLRRKRYRLLFPATCEWPSEGIGSGHSGS